MASEKTASLGFKDGLQYLIKSFWATFLGLACARCSIIIGSYGSYHFTDDGINTDGSALVMIAFFMIVLAIMVALNISFSKRQVNRMMRASIVLQAALLVALGLATQNPNSSETFIIVLHIVNEIFGMFMIAYWIRYIRGANMLTTLGIIAIGMAVSEVVLFICVYVPNPFDDFTAAILTLCQFAFMLSARKVKRPFQVRPEFGRDLLTDFVKDNASSKRFLTALALGIGFMAIVIGLLRGYPAGQPIAFSAPSRFAYFFLVIIVCALIVVVALRRNRKVVSTYSWIVMQALACTALLLYTVFPNTLEVGAVATTVLNAIMVMYTCFGVAAFMGYGWRDPFFYAIGGFTVFLFSRALARRGELFLFNGWGFDPLEITVVITCCIVASSQVVFTQLIKINDASDEKELKAKNSRFVKRFMGIDNESAPETMEDVRMKAMQTDIEELGKQFLLSDREVEVLTLYAMGHTQQKVADELCISPGTVHAHIKRIYAKTGLHSRQAILDYLKVN